MIVTGGGDCPGLNAVIRAVVKRAAQEKDWEVLGSIKAFDGILNEPSELMILDEEKVAGIHYQGGTIIQTTNKEALCMPVKKKDGSYEYVDRSDEMIRKIQYLGIDAVISIGATALSGFPRNFLKKGSISSVFPRPLTMTFGDRFYFRVPDRYPESGLKPLYKLVTTAASHNRVFILEVMGRDAGWIALNAAVAGGAEICLIPEIPYDLNVVLSKINSRFHRGRGFAIIVAAEGAHPKEGTVVGHASQEVGYENLRLGGLGFKLEDDLKKAGCEHDIRVTVLGHLQRGGVSIAYDRVLATQFGVKAMEMVLNGEYGRMVSYNHPYITSVTLKDAIQKSQTW
jgi:6-phosphofructokinase 1